MKEKMNKFKESSWAVPFFVTVTTLLFSWFFSVGFTLQTPRDFMDKNEAFHAQVETRLDLLETQGLTTSRLMQLHTQRVCRLDSLDDLAKAGWLNLCKEVGVDRGVYAP